MQNWSSGKPPNELCGVNLGRRFQGCLQKLGHNWEHGRDNLNKLPRRCYKGGGRVRRAPKRCRETSQRVSGFGQLRRCCGKMKLLRNRADFAKPANNPGIRRNVSRRSCAPTQPSQRLSGALSGLFLQHTPCRKLFPNLRPKFGRMFALVRTLCVGLAGHPGTRQEISWQRLEARRTQRPRGGSASHLSELASQFSTCPHMFRNSPKMKDAMRPIRWVALYGGRSLCERPPPLRRLLMLPRRRCGQPRIEAPNEQGRDGAQDGNGHSTRGNRPPAAALAAPAPRPPCAAHAKLAHTQRLPPPRLRRRQPPPGPGTMRGARRAPMVTPQRRQASAPSAAPRGARSIRACSCARRAQERGPTRDLG